MAYTSKAKKVGKSISPAMEKKLQVHKAQGHSAKHMAKMRVLLKEGRSFPQSHAMALKMVGK